MPLEESNDTQWYSCQSELGYLRVGVVIGQERAQAMCGPLSLFRQAALLGEVELVLQAIELWQQITLDLQPIEDKPAENSVAQSGSLRLVIKAQSTNAPFPVKVDFPLSALRKLKPVTDELQNIFSLSWSGLEADLIVDRFDLDDDELAGLEHGSLLLLPRSFSASWITELCLPVACSQSVIGVFDYSALKLIPSDATQSPCAANAAYSVKLSAGVTVTPEILLGFENGCSIELEAATTNLNAELLYANQIIASGSLGPIGAGYALFVETVSKFAQCVQTKRNANEQRSLLK